MCSEMRIPGDFDVAQISWRPDYDPFFYRQLARRARRIYLFREEYIFDVEKAGVVETPQLGHATYVFAKPRNLDTFLALYTKIAKDVKHIRTTFATVLAAAEMQGLIPSNPARQTKLPRRGPVAEKTPIAPEKIRQLLEALPEPSRSLAWLLALTGLRIGELLALRWRDIDLALGCLRVRQTVYEGRFDDPKTRRSKRTVPLGAKGVEILSAFTPQCIDPEALVFATRRGTPFSRRNLLNRQLAPTCGKLGIEGVTWHWLRHANATLLDAVGTPLGTVQALLGHSSAEVTREIYLYSVPADVRSAVEKVEELLIGPKWTQVAEATKVTSTLIH